MLKFEKVSKYAADGLQLPTRATTGAAGYDFYVAEDTIVPPYEYHKTKIENYAYSIDSHNIKENKILGKLFNSLIHEPFTLNEVATMTKNLGTKPTLVPTGVKCQLPQSAYLELSLRSSTPLKHWLLLANSVGIIDSDYYNNPDNEGHIFFQVINLFPYAIILKKGDKIGQGILHNYLTTDDDVSCGKRVGGFGSTSAGQE